MKSICFKFGIVFCILNFIAITVKCSINNITPIDYCYLSKHKSNKMRI